MDDKLKFIEPVTVMAGEYPDVALRHCYMDTASMEVIRQPWAFDVVVTNNVFGDIIADELVQISGTPALFGSAELTPAGRGHLCDSAFLARQTSSLVKAAFLLAERESALSIR